jgi:hypothetical protein
MWREDLMLLMPSDPPAVHGKKITAPFDGRRITPNGGEMILTRPSASSVPRDDPFPVATKLPDWCRPMGKRH